MSETGPPGDSEYTEQPGDAGLWARFLAAPTWVKVLIPVVIVALALFIGVWIGQSGSDTSPEEGLLQDIADQLAAQPEATTTTAAVVEVTTTNEETTTTVEEDPTTTEPEPTTTVEETTTAAPTTAPPIAAPTAAPTAAPPTPAPTEPPPTEAPDTTAPTDTEPPDTTAPADTEPTEPDTTPPSDSEPPRLGTVAASLDDFQAQWNSAAENTAVAPITSWTPLDVSGRTASVADLGANLRLVALTDGSSGPVTLAVLVWLPLDDPADQPQQNELYRDAFAVLVRSVYPDATTEEQSTLAAELGLSADLPPAEDGASAEATLRRQRYRLAGLDVSGAPGVDTLISVESALAR